MIRFVNVSTGLFVQLISIVIVKFNSQLRDQYFNIKNVIVSSNFNRKKLPLQLLKCVLTIEDRRYYSHLGIDIYSITRAILKNNITNRLEGASTIDQQLIRNITDKREIKIRRKINEIILATLINCSYTKKEILYTYFDTYKFNNCTGIFNFCLKEDYDLNNLSVKECAQIAARFKYPHITNVNYIKYLKRVRTIERKTTPPAQAFKYKFDKTYLNNFIKLPIFVIKKLEF
jgi:membrane carboxypeptidase/penicillin-binding protein